jgi:hypothetical protein
MTSTTLKPVKMTGPKIISRAPRTSPKTAPVNDEVQREIDRCYREARTVVKKNVFSASLVCDGLNLWVTSLNGRSFKTLAAATEQEAAHSAKKLFYKQIQELKDQGVLTGPQSRRLHGRDVLLSHHAIVRFWQRALKNVGTYENAERVLRERMNHIAIQAAPPSWQRYHRNADAWLAPEKLSLPLMLNERGQYVAVTCCHYSMMKLSDQEMVRTGRKHVRAARL